MGDELTARKVILQFCIHVSVSKSRDFRADQLGFTGKENFNISDGKNRKKFEASEIAVQLDLKRKELRILK